jgi:membrane-bound lytic murein transglycosylase B
LKLASRDRAWPGLRLHRLGLFAIAGFFALQAPSTVAASKSAPPPAPSFAEDAGVIAFARDLEQRHGLNADHLLEKFAAIRPNPRVLQLIKPPATPQQRSWERYRPRFLNERRIEGGVRFWLQHRDKLARASAMYGVPEEIIVAIIGVETEYGKNTGGFRALEALATLAFHYPPRADFFRTELEQFLLLSRENRLDPLAVKGSFAGAIGIPQFMPGSQRRYAVDFDGDERIDLANSLDDAIGSVGRFLEQHGWQAGKPVAEPVRGNQSPPAELLDAGIRPSLGLRELRAAGISNALDEQGKVALIDLVSPERDPEYWLGHDNFYVITRYNRSSFYAMAVFQLAEEIRQRLPR